MSWMTFNLPIIIYTGISTQIGTKFCDWAVWQAETGRYSWAAVSSNDSKAQYNLPYVSVVVWKICFAARAAADTARRENTKPLQRPSET